MFFFLSKTLDVFLSPFTWAILCVAFAVRWRKRGRQRVRKRLIFVGIALLVIFGQERVANRLWYAAEADAEDTTRPGVVYDAAILMGGLVEDGAMERTGGQPSYNDNVERLLATFDMLREGRARTAIISGGVDVSPRYIEARVLKDQLVRWGIAEDRVLVEDRARNTRENAVYVAEIARARGLVSLVVVTSAFHMRRSLDCFHAVGLDPDAYPVDFRASVPGSVSESWIPRVQQLAKSTAALRELLGRLIYRVRGYGS